jgi:UDP-N-acetylmuramyl pentapeptide phosphotransferase/UDP-N-acetylglucosamine-1-phosphate transferase
MKHLFDLPDDRKVHATPVPSLGGIGIFAGFIIALMLSLPEGVSQMQYLIAAFLVIFFLGLKDDIIVLTPFKKFLGQLLAAGIIVFKGEILITGLHGFLGISEMPVAISYAFTFFTIIVITNSFNLIDGVDGLAGTLGVVATASFGTYFLLSGTEFYAVMAFCMTGSLLAFLIFNISPARIFMGDTGSLLLGILNSILVIKFIEIASRPDAAIPLTSAPAIGFAILFVPLFDTLRIFAYRILNRRSPFSPDRNHVHHILLEKGCSHNMVVFLAVLFNLCIMAATIMGRGLSNTELLIGLVSIGFSTISILIYTNRAKRRQLLDRTFNRNAARSIELETKVISIKTENAVKEASEALK